jgi:hypothetical protein
VLYNRLEDLFSNDWLALQICRNFFESRGGKRKTSKNQKKSFPTAGSRAARAG